MKRIVKALAQNLLDNFGYSIYSKDFPVIPEDKVIKYYINQASRFTGKSVTINTIFDVGANIGQTALTFNQLFPNCQIYCFEPINKTFNELGKNTKQFKNIHAFNLALGSETSVVKVYLKPNNQWNSLANNETWIMDPNDYEMVNVETLDDFVERQQIHQIDLLKTDTEGFDLQVFKGSEKILKDCRVKFIISEVGFLKNDLQHSYFEEICVYLNSRGFRLLGFLGVMDDICHYFLDDQLCLGYCNCIFFNSQSLMETK